MGLRNDEAREVMLIKSNEAPLSNEVEEQWSLRIDEVVEVLIVDEE